MSYKERFSLIERKKETHYALNKYHDKLPVICEKDKNASKDTPIIDKNKYLIPFDLTIGQFVYIIRKRLKITPEKAIYLFIKNIIPPTSALFFDVYSHLKDDDGFLYITYSAENTFG